MPLIVGVNLFPECTDLRGAEKVSCMGIAGAGLLFLFHEVIALLQGRMDYFLLNST